MNIKFSDLVITAYNESSIRRLITYVNADIMNMAAGLIMATEQEILHEDLISACTWFATSLYATYHSGKIQEILQMIDEDSDNILTTCANDEHLLDTIGYEIGTNSEGIPNYSVVERMVLVCAAAKKMGYKFDFSWNL